MVTLPDKTALGTRDPRAARGIPNYPQASPIASALQGFGNTVADIGFEQARTQKADDEQAQKFGAQSRFLEFQQSWNETLTERSQTVEPGAVGFSDKVRQDYFKAAKKFLGSVPADLKAEFDQKLFVLESGLSDKAGTFERSARKQYYSDKVNDGLTLIENNLYDNPENFDGAVFEGNQFIDSIPDTDVSPIEKEALRRAWKQKAQLASLNGMTPAGRLEALGAGGGDGSAVETVVDRIIGAESGGDPNAKNPRSSAEGAGQFIDSTWLAMIRKYRPDIAAGKSADQIIALKRDGSLSREMTAAYAQENSAFLAAQGVPTTPGNIYLAHFLGPRGGAQVLKADPAASVASIVGPDVMRANPFLAGKSAADLVAWAAKKMGGPGSAPGRVDPRFADVDYVTRQKLIDTTVAEQKRTDTETRAIITAQRAALKDSLSLGIQTGTVVSDQDILSADVDDGDKAVLLRALETKRKDGVSLEAAIRDFQAGTLSVDPYDAKGKKTVDDLYRAASAVVQPEQVQAVTDEIVRQTGTVPQPALSQIRQGLASQDIETLTQAAQQAQRLAAINPAALTRRGGGSEVQKAADDFSFYVNKLNLSPEEAARRMIEKNAPEKQFQRKALEPAAKEFIKEIEGEDLGASFDDSFLGWRSNPDIGFTPAQEFGIKAEFLAIAEDQFYATNGDPDLARNRAVEEMKRLYGVTEIGGSRTVIKHPPERYWPAMPGASDPYGYAKDQIFEAYQDLIPDAEIVSQYGHLVKADDAENISKIRRQIMEDSMIIVTTPQTDAMIKRGELPAYSVLFKDAAGAYQTLPGKLFQPDISSLGAAQEEAIGRARQLQEEQRFRAEQSNAPDGGREQSLDSFLDGPPLPPTGSFTPSSPEKQTLGTKIEDSRDQLFDRARDRGVAPGAR